MNWTHLHLALNHIPVLGTAFIALLLITGLIKKSEEIRRLSLWWMAVLMLLAIPTKFTGDFANEQSAEEPWLINTFVTQHEQAADQATTGIFLAGLMAIAGLIAARKKPAIPTWALIGTLVLSLLTTALMGRAANLGGQIRHSEIRQH